MGTCKLHHIVTCKSRYLYGVATRPISMGGFYVQSHTTKCKDLEKTLDDGLSVDILYSLLVPGGMNN